MSKSKRVVPKITRAKMYQSVPDLISCKRVKQDIIVRDGDYSYMTEDVDLSTWEKFYFVMSFLVRNMGVILSVIYWFIRLIMEINMFGTKDKKTTIAAIVKIIVAVITVLGIGIPSDIQDAVVVGAIAIWSVVDFIQGLFTKDSDSKKDDEDANKVK